ncbi:MAG TPA: amidohydrolase [Bacteroidales bacterium]|nr:amidohydrolase [Bacteroidales bacterium]
MGKLFDIKKIITLRHKLHQHPELSDSEAQTALRIINFIESYHPNQIITEIGGHGVAVVFKGKNKGPSVLFRCELDGLPINDLIEKNYRSQTTGVGHKCGHDGHMAILVGLADVFSRNRPETGEVILMFQPAEENGQGAHRVINDERFKQLNVDYAFALHNLPGYGKGVVVLGEKNFASASTGMIIKLTGKTSHAGEPEKGNSPAIAMADIVKELTLLPQKENVFNDFVLVTVIHVRLGEIAFGTTPGYAEIMATLRSYTNSDMEILTQQAEKIAKESAQKNNLKYEISYVEEFPATINDTNLVHQLRQIAKTNKIPIKQLKKPFRWSEDFAHFTLQFPGVLFGLGSGVNHPQLHNPDYDFPDDIIENGVKMFYGIYQQIIKNKQK